MFVIDNRALAKLCISRIMCGHCTLFAASGIDFLCIIQTISCVSVTDYAKYNI